MQAKERREREGVQLKPVGFDPNPTINPLVEEERKSEFRF